MILLIIIGFSAFIYYLVENKEFRLKTYNRVVKLIAFLKADNVYELKEKENILRQDEKNILELKGIKEDLERKSFIYENNDFFQLLNNYDKRKLESIEILINNNVISYAPTLKYILNGTNDEIAHILEEQREFITDTLGSLDIEVIKQNYDSYLGYSKVKFINNNIEINKRLYNDMFKEESSNRLLNELVESKNKTYYTLYTDNIKQMLESYEIFASDILTYIENRITYMNSAYLNSKTGVDGEERVNNELNKYEDFINIKSKTFNLAKIDIFNENYKVECDNILITKYGVFVLETKNIGENSISIDSKTGSQFVKYKLHIEKEGRWVKRFHNGNIEVWDKNPVVQNRDHILKLQKIINKELNSTEIEIKGIIVIANDSLEIENESNNINICRVSGLYEAITSSGKDETMTEKMMNDIEKIINKYNTEEHEPERYKIINIVDEFNQIDNMISSSLVLDIKSKIDKIYNTLCDFNVKKDIAYVKNEVYSLVRRHTVDMEDKYIKQNMYKGTLKYIDGEYIGSLYDDKFEKKNYRHGYGECRYSNGDIYKGEFIWDKMIGRGEFTYYNGDIYRGQFLDGKYNGNGVLYYNNGDVYKGDFVNNKEHGVGTLNFGCGNIYEGTFMNGYANGSGKLIQSDGLIYEGNFALGKPDGMGKVTLANGEMYDNQFFINGVWYKKSQYYNENNNLELAE